jgi:integrase
MFLNILKTWAGFLEREGVWADSPLRKVRRVKTRRYERQPFTRARSTPSCTPPTAAACPSVIAYSSCCCSTQGARISEATGLHLGDVRLDAHTIRVLGKGNRERTIPIGSANQPDGGPLFRAYRAWLKVRGERQARSQIDAGDRLFLTPAGYALTSGGGTELDASARGCRGRRRRDAPTGSDTRSVLSI